MAEIAEDEWGSDVSEDNGGGMLEELGADEWGSDDADANREGSSEDDADEDEEDAPARPNKATEQQPNRGRGLPADAAGDASGTGSEEESDPSSENNDDDDMSSGDEEAGMDMDEAGASDEDDDDEEGDDKGAGPSFVCLFCRCSMLAALCSAPGVVANPWVSVAAATTVARQELSRSD